MESGLTQPTPAAAPVSFETGCRAAQSRRRRGKAPLDGLLYLSLVSCCSEQCFDGPGTTALAKLTKLTKHFSSALETCVIQQTAKYRTKFWQLWKSFGKRRAMINLLAACPMSPRSLQWRACAGGCSHAALRRSPRRRRADYPASTSARLTASPGGSRCRVAAGSLIRRVDSVPSGIRECTISIGLSGSATI